MASVTLSWSADVVAVIRYYRLQAATLATPEAPASSEDLGDWTETEPDVDVSKVLYTCWRTVYADGTEGWGRVSRDSSYEAAKTAQSSADAARQAAASAMARAAACTCDTAATVADKAAEVVSGSFEARVGATVSVVFAEANTAAAPTLDVGGTGAASIRTNGAPYAYWAAGSCVSFVYDGTYWQTCSVPVYAAEATVGNPGAENLHLGGGSLDVRDGAEVLASFTESEVSFLKGLVALSSGTTTVGGAEAAYAALAASLVRIVGGSEAALLAHDASSATGPLAAVQARAADSASVTIEAREVADESSGTSSSVTVGPGSIGANVSGTELEAAPVYRLHNAYANAYLLTPDESERASLVAAGWEQEDTKFWALRVSS